MSGLDSGRCTFEKKRIQRHFGFKIYPYAPWEGEAKTVLPPFHNHSGIPFPLKYRLILPDFLSHFYYRNSLEF